MENTKKNKKDKSEEEIRLESLLFGSNKGKKRSSSEISGAKRQKVQLEENFDKHEDSQLFVISTKPKEDEEREHNVEEQDVQLDTDNQEEKGEEEENESKLRPVWEDEDEIVREAELKARYLESNPDVSWAKLPEKLEEEEKDDLGSSSSEEEDEIKARKPRKSLLQNTGHLKPGLLSFHKLPRLNAQKKSAVSTFEQHYLLHLTLVCSQTYSLCNFTLTPTLLLWLRRIRI
eukprot:TRINITY_DN6192_c0_g1_i1.p2 TRINITY_DN6192_c0_g1~~TRINITY_DN6192_c0_g1_i1.p2  ORF type:complete len:247 (-),score=70.17 TRINITY_DN6192_c0_g1_i1:1064-1759(-)